MALEKHRSFTIRVPMSRYLELSELAEKEQTHLNVKVNQLLALGLGEQIKLDRVLARLIRRAATEDTTND